MKARSAFAAVLLGFGALIASTQASAQGFYVGGAFGSTDAGEGNAIPDLITSGAVDGKGSGFKFYGGYAFTPNVAVEMAFVDLGRLKYSGSFVGAPVTNGRVDTSGLNSSVVGTLPLGSGFSLFAKAGLFAWTAEARDITNGFPFSGTDSGAGLSVGVGGEFHVTRNLGLRAEWESFDANDTISMVSLGLAYHF